MLNQRLSFNGTGADPLLNDRPLELSEDTRTGSLRIRATPIGFHIKGYGLIGLGLAEGTTLEEAMHLADHMNRPGRAAESATAFK
jgi:hypothetical protein